MRTSEASGTVVGVWRYPVKSMRGEALDTAPLTVRGLAGDRVYALVDRATGHIASAKHPRLWGRLLTCRASVLPPPTSPLAPTGEWPGAGRDVQIELPTCQRLLAGEECADAVLSAWLARAVMLSAEPPARPEIERYWPDVEGLALRDTVTTGAIGGAAPHGTFFDYAPIHLLTTTTLAHLRALYPTGQLAVQRFRPNLLLAPQEATAAFIENTWVGRTLLIGGEVRLRVTNPTPRCVVPTLAQPDLPPDLGILRAIATHNRPPIPALDGAAQPCLGAYAIVEQGGIIRHGAPIRVLSDG